MADTEIPAPSPLNPSAETAPDDRTQPSDRVQLWPGDPGTLPLDVRRTLVALLRGPYVSPQRAPELWSTLLAHEGVIRRRLGDLLLDLAIDADTEVAFTRNLVPDPDFDRPVPSVLRGVSLTFIDSALLLHLRHLLLQGAAQHERVVVGRDELDAHMRAYSASSGHDEAQFGKRLLASINKMIKWSLLLPTDTEERWEISTALGLILTADEISGIEAEYERLREDVAGTESSSSTPRGAGDADDAADDAADAGAGPARRDDEEGAS